ncbi:hypothetical protein CVT25_009726 [Psilocybe cyanescens]|uniref:Uncharacterized protein n=1 Tax=Psilocybe cyanescens TaxID=93625 RepID=A0A409XGQ0_PSICY|nr:hypothetical protein CVT25_009726 [Psilocybe cyanescens]
MMLYRDQEDSSSNAHPFSYARVLEVFLVNVRHTGPQSTTNLTHSMHFVWVRWFEIDYSYAAGWTAPPPWGDHICFVNSESPDAFGFVDPSDVLRGAHFIPAFAHGSSHDHLPGKSIVRTYLELNEENQDGCFSDEDWSFSMSTDRDMFVRYLGGGIGHVATNMYTQSLCPANWIAQMEVPVEEEGEYEEQPEEGRGSSAEEEEHSERNSDEELVEDDKDYDGENGEEPWEMGDVDAEGIHLVITVTGLTCQRQWPL